MSISSPPASPPPNASNGGLPWPIVLGLLAVAFAPLTYGAARAFPIWDDAAVTLILWESGARAILPAHRDRPLFGQLMTWYANGPSFLGVALVVHAAVWIATGAITAAVWRVCFPRLAAYAVIPGLVALSPILCEMQLIPINPVLSGQLGPVLVFASLLLAHVGLAGSPARRVATAIGAALGVFVGALLSEYAVAALIGGGALLFGLAWLRGDAAARRRALIVGGALAVMGIAGYLVFHRIGAADARQVVRPEYQLRAQGLRRFVELPLRLPFALWDASLGAVFKKAGAVQLAAGEGAAIGFGALLAALAWLALRRRDHQVSAASRERLRIPTIAVVAASLLLALVPVILLKTSPHAGSLSRLWLSVLPIAPCLTIYILLVGLHGRARLIALTALVFVAGFTSMSGARASIRTRDAVVLDGQAVRPHLHPTGTTVALYTQYTGTTLGTDPLPDSNELMARMTKGWTPDERLRFWASVASYVYTPDAIATFARQGACGHDHARVDFPGVGGFCGRHAPIARVLWLSRLPDGTLSIVAEDPAATAGAAEHPPGGANALTSPALDSAPTP